MSTPREEVERNLQQSNGLKPDKTTSQPPKPQRGLPQEQGRMTTAQINAGTTAFNNKQTAGAADPRLEAAYAYQRALEQRGKVQLPTSGTSADRYVDGFANRALNQLPAPSASRNGRGPGYVSGPPQGPVRAADPMVNSFADRVDPNLPNGLPTQEAAPQLQRKLSYGPVAGYRGPDVGAPAAANIAGGLTRDEIVGRIEAIGNDRNARLSPTLMRSMAEPYVNMLGDKDKAELQREKGGMDLQQTSLQGQTQGALETQRGMNKAAESQYNQEGSQVLEELRQNAPTELTDAAGNTFLRRGLKAEAVTGPDGKPIKQAVKSGPVDNTRLEAAKALAGNPFDPEAAAQGNAILMEMTGGGAQTQEVPAGYTLAGISKDGKRVFKDANGNLFSE